MMPGYTMRPLLLCSKCPHSVDEIDGRGVRGMPDVGGGELSCPECGAQLILTAVAIIAQPATVDDLTRYGLRRCYGTWWN